MQEIKKSYFYRRRLIGCEWICLTTLYYILDYVLTPPLRIRKKGNQGPFMTKQLSKTIMNRSKLRNKYIKWPFRENFLDYEKAKNTCNTLNKLAKKSYFDKVTSKDFVSNKAFWNTVKPFLANKGFLTNKNITIKHKDKTVTVNSELAHLFNTILI